MSMYSPFSNTSTTTRSRYNSHTYQTQNSEYALPSLYKQEMKTTKEIPHPYHDQEMPKKSTTTLKGTTITCQPRQSFYIPLKGDPAILAPATPVFSFFPFFENTLNEDRKPFLSFLLSSDELFFGVIGAFVTGNGTAGSSFSPVALELPLYVRSVEGLGMALGWIMMGTLKVEEWSGVVSETSLNSVLRLGVSVFCWVIGE